MTIKQSDNKNKIVPRKVILSGLMVILLFFGGLGGVAALMPFSGAVIVQGSVKVAEEKKTVQHLEGGIVDQIFVKAGDRVEKGDVLITLKSSQVQASVNLLKGRHAAKLVEAARLEAQRDLKAAFAVPQDSPEGADMMEVIMSEKDIFEKTKKTLESRINIQKTRISQLNEKIIGAKNELKSNKEIMLSLEEEIKAKVPLMEERYIDKTQILTLNRMLAERKGQEARLIQAVAEAEENIEELRFSIVSLENSYRETASSSLVKVKDEIFQIDMQLVPQMDADKRLSIKAPVSGIVINLAIHSEDGGVIRPGAPVLDIVPEDADLIVECSLRQDKITQVRLGQETRVQLSAFNRITTPPIPGIVSYISADSVMQRLPSGEAGFSSYIIYIRVDKKMLADHNVWLMPGMPVTCFITTEKRTFLQYMLEPILLNIDKAMRETL